MTNSSVRLSRSDLKVVPPKVPDRPGSSQKVYSVESIDGSDGGDYLDQESLDLVDEYYYGVRIFPGQDPNHVCVGWVTSQYHVPATPDKAFDLEKVRRVTIRTCRDDDSVKET